MRYQYDKQLRFWVALALGILIVAVVVILVSCGGERAPYVENDGPQQYDQRRIPVDERFYHITGIVESDVQSLVRQIEAARGRISGNSFGGWGHMSGSFFGPEYGGKGFVRLQVEASDSGLAPVGRSVILKTSDTKAIMLYPGDRVTLTCRAQYEAVAAVKEREKLDIEAAGTWELDYCRLVTPVVEVPQ